MNFAGTSELIAFEESSHAVIRDFFGAEVTEIAIGDGQGHCDFRATRTGDIALFQNIAGCLAGKVAADRVRGYKVMDEQWRVTKDYQRALDSALRLNAGDSLGAELLLRWLERRTELLIEKHWPKIHELAFALLENDQLTGEQIREVLAKK
jgi:hypothetical protein